MKKQYTKYVVSFLCLLLFVGLLIGNPHISVETILEFTPQSPVKAAVVLLLLYALKGATFFFPVIILEIAVGHLFAPIAALGINLAGKMIILTIPYLIGRAVGMDTVQKLIQKHPRFKEIVGKQQDNALFLCFFLRSLSFLPGNVVTMYFGATKIPFWKNFAGGIIGLLPETVLVTFMGGNIKNPESPAFWVSAILMLTLMGLSLLLYYAYRKHLQKNLIQKTEINDPPERNCYE